MKKTKKPKSTASPAATGVVELRLPTDVMATLAHASVLSGQPVEVVINVLLAMKLAADKRS